MKRNERTLFEFKVDNIGIGRHVNLENDQIQRAEDAGEMYLEFQVECLIFMPSGMTLFKKVDYARLSPWSDMSDDPCPFPMWGCGCKSN